MKCLQIIQYFALPKLQQNNPYCQQQSSQQAKQFNNNSYKLTKKQLQITNLNSLMLTNITNLNINLTLNHSHNNSKLLHYLNFPSSKNKQKYIHQSKTKTKHNNNNNNNNSINNDYNAQNGNNQCQEYSKSSSKRLFQSVFKILEYDQQKEISTFQHIEDNVSDGIVGNNIDNVEIQSQQQNMDIDADANLDLCANMQYHGIQATSHLAIPTKNTQKQSQTLFLNKNKKICANGTNGTNGTNGAKIQQYLSSPQYTKMINDKIMNQGYHRLYPILKLKCVKFNNNNQQLEDFIQLDSKQIHNIFKNFSNLYTTISQKPTTHTATNTIYLLYTKHISAYIALKLMNNFAIKINSNIQVVLRLEWCVNASDYQTIMNMMIGHDGNDSEIKIGIQEYVGKICWEFGRNNSSGDDGVIKEVNSDVQNNTNSNNANNNAKQSKLTCRYDIQIQNQKQFQVARRIIGSKGSNMKKIIQSTLQKSLKHEKQNSQNPSQQKCSTPLLNNINNNQSLKLRLRGKGSGYKQGPQQQQSEQQLHLCISAKDQIVYNFACQAVQTLLENIYQQYRQFCMKKYGRVVDYKVKRNQFVMAVGGTSNNSHINNNQNIQNIMPNYQYQHKSMINLNNPYHHHNQYSHHHMHYSPHSICHYQPNHNQNLHTNIHNLTPDKIQQYLQLRNKARKQLNFHEADRIRNYLKFNGVLLIDQKGKRGRAVQVTTWKYI